MVKTLDSCLSARRRLISSFDQCSFLMITGRFDLYLRAFSISAGDGKWLSIGVDLNASSAFCGLDLDIAAFFRVYLTFDESIRLWEVWAGRYVVEAPLGGEVSKSLTAIVSTVVAHNLAWRSILRKHLTHLRYDAVTRHLPLDAVDKREFRVVVTDEKIRVLSYGKQVCADDLPRTCR